MRQVVWGTETECKAKIKKYGSPLKWFKASKAEHKEHAKVFGFDAKEAPVSYWANELC